MRVRPPPSQQRSFEAVLGQGKPLRIADNGEWRRKRQITFKGGVPELRNLPHIFLIN